MDIHDNPPLPDNVMKEEDNRVRNPISTNHHVVRTLGVCLQAKYPNSLKFMFPSEYKGDEEKTVDAYGFKNI